jgi:hypothetical protein
MSQKSRAGTQAKLRSSVSEKNLGHQAGASGSTAPGWGLRVTVTRTHPTKPSCDNPVPAQPLCSWPKVTGNAPGRIPNVPQGDPRGRRSLPCTVHAAQ